MKKTMSLFNVLAIAFAATISATSYIAANNCNSLTGLDKIQCCNGNGASGCKLSDGCKPNPVGSCTAA